MEDIKEINERIHELSSEIDGLRLEIKEHNDEKLTRAFRKHFPLHEASDILDPWNKVLNEIWHSYPDGHVKVEALSELGH